MLNQVLFHGLSMENEEISEIIKYLTGILTSKFKIGTGGRFPSPALLVFFLMYFLGFLFYMQMTYRRQNYH